MHRDEIAWRKIAAELKRTVPACKSKLYRLNGQELNVTSSDKENNNHTQTATNDYSESGNVSVSMATCYDSAYESACSSDEDGVMKEEENIFKDNKKNKKDKKTEKKCTLRSRSTDKKNASITKRRAHTNNKARNKM